MMDRSTQLEQAKSSRQPWDILVIGGGATGLGIAVDAASRDFRVLLVEQSDFGQGTSSRSTKLIHGGVRYLRQGNISLVRESLRERSLLRANAPHLVHDLSFVIPTFSWFDTQFFGMGMKVYDLLAGGRAFGRSQTLSPAETRRLLPTVTDDRLRGGVLYHDGQFDDARLLISLAQTAVDHQATVLNYCRVEQFLKNQSGLITGAVCHDRESNDRFEVSARCIINATGAFCDAVRRLDDSESKDLIAPSQGSHLVVDRRFLPGDAALMVPRTTDGRLMFAIPWHGHTLIGTTDTPVPHADLAPRPLDDEIDFMLETAGRYLNPAPLRQDVLSMFAGIRPLVSGGKSADTSVISREHSITCSESGLLTIAGGKWTTYRQMAEDCVDQAVLRAGLPPRPCRTKTLILHGGGSEEADDSSLAMYGSDASGIRDLESSDPALAEKLHPEFPTTAAQVVWAARHEMARTIEDVLSRRTRILPLHAQAALQVAPRVAALMAEALGYDQEWQDAEVSRFATTAQAFLLADG